MEIVSGDCLVIKDATTGVERRVQLSRWGVEFGQGQAGRVGMGLLGSYLGASWEWRLLTESCQYLAVCWVGCLEGYTYHALTSLCTGVGGPSSM